jgi:hypothetical protein
VLLFAERLLLYEIKEELYADHFLYAIQGLLYEKCVLLFANRLLLYEVKEELYADHFFIRD